MQPYKKIPNRLLIWGVKLLAEMPGLNLCFQNYHARTNSTIIVSIYSKDMRHNLHNKRFHSLSNSHSGDVGEETIFHYFQEGETVWATYHGGAIRQGTIIARWLDDGQLEMCYQHLGTDHVFKSGQCLSTPELLANGKLRMLEQWQWTAGKEGAGTSIIEEI